MSKIICFLSLILDEFLISVKMIKNTLRKNVGSSSPAVGIIKGIVVRLVGTYGVGIYQMIIVNLLFDSEYTMACIVKSGVRVKKHKYCHVN